MAFHVDDDVWTDHQASLCKGVLLVHARPSEEYNLPALLELLARHKLVYTMSEFQPIRRLLVERGVLESDD